MPQAAPARNHPRNCTFTFTFPSAPVIYPGMKATLATIFLAIVSSAFVGCESDLPPNAEPNQPLRRGLSGQGKLSEPDRSNDPLIKEETRTGY
jgi:hypothetical protein